MGVLLILESFGKKRMQTSLCLNYCYIITTPAALFTTEADLLKRFYDVHFCGSYLFLVSSKIIESFCKLFVVTLVLVIATIENTEYTIFQLKCPDYYKI